MTKLISLAIIITILAACTQHTASIENTKTHLYVDRTINRTSAQQKSLPFIFNSNGDKLVGRILMAINDNPKPTIIFLHGNPGFEKNEDIGQALRRDGYNAVFFSYSGTWGNEGIFNYQHSVDDLNFIIKYLSDNASTYRVNTEKIYVCGFSMGGDIAIIAATKNKNIKAVISIDPWNGYHQLNNMSDNELTKYKNNVALRPCISIKSGSDYVNSIINNDEMNLQKSIKGSTIPMVHIFGRQADLESFKTNCKLESSNNLHLIKTVDHSFSDKRITLTNYIAEWLSNLPK